MMITADVNTFLKDKRKYFRFANYAIVIGIFSFSMEAHAVHYNKKYGNFKEAADKHDGLAVVAFFLKATDDDEHPCFNKMTEAVKKINKINSATSLPSGTSKNLHIFFLLFFF